MGIFNNYDDSDLQELKNQEAHNNQYSKSIDAKECARMNVDQVFNLIGFFVVFFLVLATIYFKRKSFQKVWVFGTTAPIQRIGLIVLIIGIASLFSWVLIKDISINRVLQTNYMPRSRDSIFFHLYFYFIPLGFFLTWGYFLIVKIANWILRNKR